MRFIAKVGVGTPAQYRHRLTNRRTGAKANVLGIKTAYVLFGYFGIGYRYRFTGKGQIKTIQIDDDRQADSRIFGQAIGDEGAIQNFLAGGTMDL